MLLELLRPLSFLLSILSLYPVMMNAFFVPGSQWEERMEMALLRVVIAACVCFASGLLYCRHSARAPEPPQTLFSTLPVRLFLWTVGGVVLLFLLSLYLEAYYVPLASRDCCRL